MPTVQEIQENFVIVHPQYAEFPAPALEARIEIALTHVCEANFGKRYKEALYLFLRHLIASDGLTPDGSVDGKPIGAVVQSHKVGDVEVRFDTSTSKQAQNNVGKDPISQQLATTPFGLQYLALKRSLGFGFMVTGGDIITSCGSCVGGGGGGYSVG